MGLTVDDETLARETAARFQENGRYIGTDELRRRLELQGRTVEEFEQWLRDALLRERLERIVTDGVAVTPAEAEREFRRRTEQVKAEYALVDAAPFRAAAAVSDEDAARRFAADRDAYRIPEQRSVQYLLVDEAVLQGRVAVTDREIEGDYEEHRDDFKEPEEACASHILVKVKAQPEATEGHPEEEARKMADNLLAQVKAGGDFAAIAKKSSEDKGSAPRRRRPGLLRPRPHAPRLRERGLQPEPRRGLGGRADRLRRITSSSSTPGRRRRCPPWPR